MGVDFRSIYPLAPLHSSTLASVLLRAGRVDDPTHPSLMSTVSNEPACNCPARMEFLRITDLRTVRGLDEYDLARGLQVGRLVSFRELVIRLPQEAEGLAVIVTVARQGTEARCNLQLPGRRPLFAGDHKRAFEAMLGSED